MKLTRIHFTHFTRFLFLFLALSTLASCGDERTPFSSGSEQGTGRARLSKDAK